MPVFGLMDCNNFYASCETVFNPALRNRAVVVLSNNDGCVIARSPLAKQMGIKMGTPAFEIRAQIQSGQVVAFSSNYQLYGDMSRRVMNILRDIVNTTYVYSIDESFFEIPDSADYRSIGTDITNTVGRATGIGVSVGMAPTKTLAKVANHLAKKYPGYKRVCVIETPHQRERALELTPIDDVWGIGRRYAAQMQRIGVQTALDFARLDRSYVRRMMTVVGEKTWCELNGISCINLETDTLSKHQICTSRSFGTMLTTMDDIAPAITTFATRCAEKLRRGNLYAGAVMPFIYTNRFRPDLPQCNLSQIILMPNPTNDTRHIVHAALAGLQSMFRDGFQYKKAGVIVSDIVTEQELQPNLFCNPRDDAGAALMMAIDNVNQKFGRGTLQIGTALTSDKWKMHANQLSGKYTTDINDIIEINCN